MARAKDSVELVTRDLINYLERKNPSARYVSDERYCPTIFEIRPGIFMGLFPRKIARIGVSDSEFASSSLTCSTFDERHLSSRELENLALSRLVELSREAGMRNYRSARGYASGK